MKASFWLDQRPVVAVHLVIEAAGVAKIVAAAVAPPEGRLARAAVDTLAALDALALGARVQCRRNDRLFVVAELCMVVVVVVVRGVMVVVVAGGGGGGHRQRVLVEMALRELVVVLS